MIWMAIACEAPKAPPAPPVVEPEPTEPAAPTPDVEPEVPVFEAVISELPADLRAQMVGRSWHEGCPVPLDDLRLIRATHWDFEGQVRQGELVVAGEHTAVFVDVLRTAFEVSWPIERMEPVSQYDGDDVRSMDANNTSAFNCRAITGGTRYSEHSYGHAIDLNPLRNPYISRSGNVQPEGGRAYVDRDAEFLGKIAADGPIVAAFAAHGWGWGGSWTTTKDYQHFSVNGR